MRGVSLPPVYVTEPSEPTETSQVTQHASVPDSVEDSEKAWFRAMKKKNPGSKEVSQLRYRRTCQKLGVIPHTHFLRQIGRSIISLSGEGMNRKDIKAVCKTLMNEKMMSSLDFSDNRLDMASVGYVIDLVSRHAHLTHLSLSNNKLNGRYLHIITDMAKSSKKLRSLNLSGNELNDKESEHLAEVIEHNNTMTELSLGNNELREKGGILIGQALRRNNCLEKLDLSWNHLRGKGAECVALGLAKNTSLTYLNLSWNGFGFEGCRAMSHALTVNNTLEELDMSNNRITSLALFELAKGLVLNTGLTVCRLGNNPISTAATTPFLCSIRDAKDMPLEVLDLTAIIVDKEFEVVLEELQEMRPMTVLYDRALPIHRARQPVLVNNEPVINVDPLRILYHMKKNQRIIDMFYKMDKDSSSALSRDEIRRALEKEDFHLSSSAMDVIMDSLDTNNDGEIDLSELIGGERRLKRANIAARAAQETRDQKKSDVENALDDFHSNSTGLTSKYSQTLRPEMSRDAANRGRSRTPLPAISDKQRLTG